MRLNFIFDKKQEENPVISFAAVLFPVKIGGLFPSQTNVPERLNLNFTRQMTGKKPSFQDLLLSVKIPGLFLLISQTDVLSPWV